MNALDPASTYAHLGVGPEVTQLPLTPDFWPTIGQRTDIHSGRLFAAYDMEGDWDVWEVHPAGDELVMALGGSMTFHFDEGDNVTQLKVPDGHYAVVPAGVWHTADVPRPCRMIGITWGEDTEHRPRR